MFLLQPSRHSTKYRGHVVTFAPKDAEKVHLTHTDNLIVYHTIANDILRQVPMDPTTDASLLYVRVFNKMRLLLSILIPLTFTLKSCNNLSSALNTIRLSIKISNDDDGYVH